MDCFFAPSPKPSLSSRVFIQAATRLSGRAESKKRDLATHLRQVYRLAAKAGLIDDVELWMKFHQARNQSSHTYNVKTAELVFSISSQFLPEAQRVLGLLEARND